MPVIEWTIPAFAQLEALPQAIAFEIINRVDLLESFPEMGVSFQSIFPELENCRQLIIKRNYRILYEFDEAKNLLIILVVQHCRQQLPTSTEMKLTRMLLPPES